MGLLDRLKKVGDKKEVEAVAKEKGDCCLDDLENFDGMFKKPKPMENKA